MPTVGISPSLPIYYESSGDGMPVVFIHPPHMGQGVFKYQHELSGDFRVITYDIRGHGRSGVSNDEITIPLLAEDLAAFLDELGIDQAVIAGYSAGGAIAQEFAFTYPERTWALVLSGGFPEVSTFLLTRQYQAGLMLVRNRQDKLLSKFLARSHKVTKQDEAMLFQECSKAQPAAAYEFYKVSFHYECTDRLSQLRMPFLALYGQYSHIRPYGKVYQSEIPQMEHVLINNALHQLPIKNYRAFNHALRNFLNNIRRH